MDTEYLDKDQLIEAYDGLFREREARTDREFETMWAFATRWNDMADLVRLMDSEATAHVENPDGTVESYIVPASALNRVLAFANGSKSQATKRALDKFRRAPEGGESIHHEHSEWECGVMVHVGSRHYMDEPCSASEARCGFVPFRRTRLDLKPAPEGGE